MIRNKNKYADSEPYSLAALTATGMRCDEVGGRIEVTNGGRDTWDVHLITVGHLNKADRFDIRDGQLIVPCEYFAGLVAKIIRDNRLTDGEREGWFKQRGLCAERRKIRDELAKLEAEGRT
jgi:hypothetical protein